MGKTTPCKSVAVTNRSSSSTKGEGKFSLLLPLALSIPSNAFSNSRYMRSLLSSDVGGSCNDNGFSMDFVSLMRLLMSPSWTHNSLSCSMSCPLASAFAKKMPLMPPAEVPDRISTTKRVGGIAFGSFRSASDRFRPLTSSASK